ICAEKRVCVRPTVKDGDGRSGKLNGLGRGSGGDFPDAPNRSVGPQESNFGVVGRPEGLVDEATCEFDGFSGCGVVELKAVDRAIFLGDKEKALAVVGK